MGNIKYIFFDVANTLLHKPDLFSNIHHILIKNGFSIEINTLKQRHKLLSEAIKFPDKTSKEFYTYFNRELLYALGILPNKKMIEEIFEKCTYLKWQAFSDTEVLRHIPIPIGIISNWDNTLPIKLRNFFDTSFFKIIASKSIGIAKPDKRIFHIAFEGLDATPEEIVYIGDSIKLDIQPALELGVNALLIDREKTFNACPSQYRISNLNEILNRFHWHKE